MKQFLGLLLLLGLALAVEDTTTFDDETFVGEEVVVEESPVDGASMLCAGCRSDNKCGANKAHPIKRKVGAGACSSGDYKHYTNVASKEQCAEKCRAARSSVKFIEYNASAKKCDCDRGSSCRLCCTRSSGKGYISYELSGATSGKCPAGKCCKNHSCGCCPKNCSWKAFGGWSKCSNSCGSGTQKRSRGQNAASCGGKGCSGKSTQSRKCIGFKTIGAGACSSGDFARYTNVASKEACAKKCKAKKSSVKFIEYNAGSKKCDCDRGSSCRLCCTRSSGKGFIAYQVAPVNCSWKSYGGWSKCSKTCGGGTQSRTRGQMAASGGGKACSGSATQSRKCNKQSCCSLKQLGAGACSSGDYKYFYNVASKESCAKKCKGARSTVKFVEYNPKTKRCDCDKGSSCRLCCKTNGFTAYQINSGCTLTEEEEDEDESYQVDDEETQEFEEFDEFDEETVSVGTTQVAVGAGVLAVALFGAYKLAMRRRNTDYESLLEEA